MSSPRARLGQTESEHAASSRAKELYWREYKLRHGPLAGIRVADELRRQVIAQRPDWPTPAERADDHAAHLRALDALARVTSRTG
ncbi:MAG: hypothetical protein IT377_26450 [Polyangiaceae bacterium]|nr:hypothetical protein [Polyangiaceae bacterium]